MGDESINITDSGSGIDGAAPLLSGDGPPWPGDSPRNHPHTGRYYLAVQPWDVIFSGRITGWSDQMNITYSSGGFSGTVKAGMTAMLEQDDGTIAYIRVKTAPSGVTGSMEVAENDHLDWDYNKTVYVLNRFELWPVHPRVTFNGGLTFYKDYDIAYTDQNASFYPVPIMGPPAVAFLSGGTATIQFSGEHSYTPDGAANSSWAWTFEDGDPATYNAVATAVEWTAAGVYLISMTVTNAHGKSSTGYRYIYIFDRTGSDSPHSRFSVGELSGSLASGGWACSVEVWADSIDKNDFPESSQVVLFAEEEWGGNAVASKGMFIDRNNIKLVGWIEKNTVVFSSETGSVAFNVVGIHSLMKNCELFSCALNYDDTPTTWVGLKDLNAIRAYHHLIYWQSTLMIIVDVFLPGQLTGISPLARLPASWDIKFQDFGDGSLWSQLNGLAEDSFCLIAADRFSTFYIGRDPQTIEPVYIGDVSAWLALTKTDWHGDAEITIQDEPARSQVTLEGVQYVGGTDTATPHFSYAPGEVPAGRGQMEVKTGAILSTPDLSSMLVGRLLAIRNNPLPHTALKLLGNYGPCIDIAPFRWVLISIAVGDTPRAIVWAEREFLPTRVTDRIAVTQGGCSTDIALVAYANGGSGVTIVVPEPELVNIVDMGGSDGAEGEESIVTDHPWIEDSGEGDTSEEALAISATGGDPGVLSSGSPGLGPKHYKHLGFTAAILDTYQAWGAYASGGRGIAWDGANVLNAYQDALPGSERRHFRHEGFSAVITDSYRTPWGAPTGVAWDGANLLSSDNSSNKQYKHDGFSDSILESYYAPGYGNTGITWDGTNTLSASYAKHFMHDGFSTSILDSYETTSIVSSGMGWDGVNVLACRQNTHFKHDGFSAGILDSYYVYLTWLWGIDWLGTPYVGGNVLGSDSGTDKHYRYVGFSSSITGSYSSPGSMPTGITWDGTNVLSANYISPQKHYRHTGFSSSIAESYTVSYNYPDGMSWDGTNVLSACSSLAKVFKHTGFSAAIADSFGAPGGNRYYSVTWDGTNLITVRQFDDNVYKHNGFSSAITDSFLTAYEDPRGVTWDGTNILTVGAVTDKYYRHVGFTASVLASYAAVNNPVDLTWDGRYA